MVVAPRAQRGKVRTRQFLTREARGHHLSEARSIPKKKNMDRSQASSISKVRMFWRQMRLIICGQKSPASTALFRLRKFFAGCFGGAPSPTLRGRLRENLNTLIRFLPSQIDVLIGKDDDRSLFNIHDQKLLTFVLA